MFYSCSQGNSSHSASASRLATGRQPGGFSEHSFGTSDTKIWILKGGYRGRGGGVLPVPPLLDSDFCIGLFHINFPKKCPVAFQRPVRKVIPPTMHKHLVTEDSPTFGPQASAFVGGGIFGTCPFQGLHEEQVRYRKIQQQI